MNQSPYNNDVFYVFSKCLFKVISDWKASFQIFMGVTFGTHLTILPYTESTLVTKRNVSLRYFLGPLTYWIKNYFTIIIKIIFNYPIFWPLIVYIFGIPHKTYFEIFWNMDVGTLKAEVHTIFLQTKQRNKFCRVRLNFKICCNI